MWKVCWSKGRLYWKIAKLFHFCHLSKLVRPETYGPYHVQAYTCPSPFVTFADILFFFDAGSGIFDHPLHSGILSTSFYLITLSDLRSRNLYLLIRIIVSIPFKLFLYAFILSYFRVLVIVGFFVCLTTLLLQQQRLPRQYRVFVMQNCDP